MGLLDRSDRGSAIASPLGGSSGGGGGGGGTVTSVAMTVPSILSVAGSPITTSGTLAVTLATQSANTIFAGPTTGGAATPTFRSLVAADLPAGTGTVTSVALTVPSFLSVTGSPITTSGTLAISLSGTALPVANGGTGTTTAFNAGSVVFSGSGGTYLQDSTNFVWDDTNNRLGIGTNAPINAPLHIKNLGARKTYFEETNASTANFFSFANTGGGKEHYFGMENSSGSNLFGSGDAYALSIGTVQDHSICFHTNNATTPRLKISSTLLIPTLDLQWTTGSTRTISIAQHGSSNGNGLTIKAGDSVATGNFGGGELILQAGKSGSTYSPGGWSNGASIKLQSTSLAGSYLTYLQIVPSTNNRCDIYLGNQAVDFIFLSLGDNSGGNMLFQFRSPGFNSPAQIIGPNREGTAGTPSLFTVTAGTALTTGSGGELRVQGGAAAGTNQNGGQLTLRSGVSTGTGTSNIVLMAVSASGLNPAETCRVTGTAFQVASGKHILAAAGATSDIGSTSARFANGYFETILGIYNGGSARLVFQDGGTTPSGVSLLASLFKTGVQVGNVGIYTGDISGATGSWYIETGNNSGANANNSGSILEKTGNNTSGSATGVTGSFSWTTGNNAGTGGTAHSGSFTFTAGTVVGGTRGSFIIDARSLNVTNAPIVGTLRPLSTLVDVDLGSATNAWQTVFTAQIKPNTGNILSIFGDAGINYDATADKHDFASTGRGIVVPRLSADPGSPENGEIWYNTTSTQLKARVNGSTVVLA